MLKVYEDLYQHSIYRDDINISDHQYLLDCAMPTLVHAGSHDAALDMLPQLEKILGARSLSYILISHLGADECGGLDAILNRYPNAQPICSEHTARELHGFGVKAQIMIARPGEIISGEDFSFRIIEYPADAHLFSGILAYEQQRGIFFSSDLMIRSGNGAGEVLMSDWEAEIRATSLRQIPNRPLLKTLRRDLSLIEPKFIAVGHGYCLRMR